MDGEAAAPSGFKTEAAGELDGGNGQEREDVPIGEGEFEDVGPVGIKAGFGGGNVKLRGEGEAENRPKTKAEKPANGALLHEAFDCHWIGVRLLF